MSRRGRLVLLVTAWAAVVGAVSAGDLSPADQALVKDYHYPFPVVTDPAKMPRATEAPGMLGLYLPPKVKTVRGIIFRHALDVAPRLDEVADLWQMAWVNGYVWADKVHGNKGRSKEDQARIVRLALEDWAERTGHPELAHAPFLTLGASRTGPLSITWGKHFPGRELAWGSVVAGARNVAPADLAQLPGLNVGAEKDNLASLVGSLKDTKDATTPYGVAAMWGYKHGTWSSHDLFLPVFDQLIRQRLPAGALAVKGPVKLNEVKVEDGWLGSTEDWGTIAPYREFKGDRAKASWLPNRAAAFAWKAFCSKDPLLEMQSPAHGYVPGGQAEKKMRSFGYAARRDFTPASEIEFRADVADRAAGLKKVKYFAGDVELGEVAEAPWGLKRKGVPPGLHAVFAVGVFADGTENWSRPALLAVHGDPGK